MAGPGLLVKTTYTSGPNDKLAAVDVYKKPGAAVVNSWQDLGAKVGLDVLGALTGTGKGAISSLIKGVINGKLTLDPQAILNRMTGGNSPLGAAFRNVSDGIKSAVALPGNLANSVIATVNGTIHAVSAAAMDDVRGLSSVINAATNGNYGISIVDNGAMAGMVASVSLQGSALGLPNVFSTLARSIQSPSILSSAAGMIVGTAVRTGNLNLLMDISSSGVALQVGLQYPSLARDTFRYARPPQGLQSQGYPAYYGQVKSSMSSLSGGWSDYSRAGQSTYDASVFNGANGFSTDLLTASAISQGNSNMPSSILNGTSAGENLTDDKIAMCARNQILIDGEPQVTNMIKQRYPLVDTNRVQTPVNSTGDHSSYDALLRAKNPDFLPQPTLSGKTYDPNVLYIDGQPQRTVMPQPSTRTTTYDQLLRAKNPDFLPNTGKSDYDALLRAKNPDFLPTRNTIPDF